METNNVETNAPPEDNQPIGFFRRVQQQLSRFFMGSQPVSSAMHIYTGRGESASNLALMNINRNGLLHSFKCPVCLDFLSSPVKTCENGHFLCSKCYESGTVMGIMDSCGVCRGPILQIRVPAVDAMLENFTLPCFYSEDGCELILKASERKSHSRDCIYRPIKCDAHTEPIDCVTRIPFRLYRSHMLERHNLLHIDGGGVENKLEIMFTDEDIYNDGGIWPLQAFTFDGFTFIARNFLSNRDFLAWCTIIGTEIDAKKYRMNISVDAPLDETDEFLQASKVELNLPIYSPHIQDLDDMENGGFYPFQIPLDTLRLTDIISGNVIQDEEEVEEPGNFRYRWTVVYEFYKVQESDN